ncbi:WD40/YVTN/BNR-like repeat-containing protein [Candidatus Omnitrophota bacterium]
MKKLLLILFALAVILSFSVKASGADEVVWQNIGRENLDLKSVLVDPHDPCAIYVGSSNSILKSSDGGDSWRRVFSVRGQNSKVNIIVLDSRSKKHLYAATGSGLYYSRNQGVRWKRIFKGKSDEEGQCASVVVSPGTIYLGTRAGLFFSRNNGRNWIRSSGKLGDSRILSIALDSGDTDYVYAASVDGVFRTKDEGKSWQEIYLASPTENSHDNGDAESGDQDEDSKTSDLRYVTIDPNNPAHLYLATSNGVYKSQDRGERWQLLTDYGLLSRDVGFLLVSRRSEIFAVTDSGVFEYKDKEWHELSLRLTAQKINFLALGQGESLYAACDQGLFKSGIKTPRDDSSESILSLYYEGEPDIRNVHEAAVAYAEVSPEKINRWRKQASRKAWLPKVTLSADRNVTDLYTWETGSTSTVDDNFLRRGHDAIEWGVGFTWDFGELVWNYHQTTIDVRSKLMVQLRDDILDEVTKLYFERIRVKMELDELSIEDRKKRLQGELKLRELTASLDALTGGYFSYYLNSTP